MNDVLQAERETDAALDETVKRQTGFTRTELKAALDLVINPNDWKDKIQSYVTTDEVRLVAAAIEFFTATKPHFSYIGPITSASQTVSAGKLEANLPNSRFKIGDHLMKVQADGYRRGPAGDH